MVRGRSRIRARPVRIVVAFPAGGSSDIVARLVGQWLSERLGQAFIIENRPGAGTNIGTEVVVRAAPDGDQPLHDAIRLTDTMEYWPVAQSGLMLANLITLAHFSVSAAMSLP